MKKLPKLSESKFAKFEENKLANAHLILGGQKYGSNWTGDIYTGHYGDGCDTTTDNGWSYTLDFGHTWHACDGYSPVPPNFFDDVVGNPPDIGSGNLVDHPM